MEHHLEEIINGPFFCKSDGAPCMKGVALPNACISPMFILISDQVAFSRCWWWSIGTLRYTDNSCRSRHKLMMYDQEPMTTLLSHCRHESQGYYECKDLLGRAIVTLAGKSCDSDDGENQRALQGFEDE